MLEHLNTQTSLDMIIFTQLNLSKPMVLLTLGGFLLLLILVGIAFYIILQQRKTILQQLQLQQQSHTRQQYLLNATIHTQEKERKKIAKNLHEEIGPLLSTIKLRFNLVRQMVGKKEEQEGEQIGSFVSDAGQALDEAIFSIRQLSRGLLPATLEEFGLNSALKELSRQASIGQLKEVKYTETGSYQRLSFEEELALYRVVDELLRYIMGYSNGDKITISLIIQPSESDNSQTVNQIIIKENGWNFNQQNQEERRMHQLMHQIESRLNLLDTQLIYQSDIEKGSQFVISYQSKLNHEEPSPFYQHNPYI